MTQRSRGDTAPAQSRGRRGYQLLRIASLGLILVAGINYSSPDAIPQLRRALPAILAVVEFVANWCLRVLSYPLAPSNSIYWIYVVSSFAVALVVYLFVRREQRATGRDRRFGLRDFFRFCFPGSVWKQPSAWLDVRFFLVDVMLMGIGASAVAVVSGAAIAHETQSFVSGLFDSPPLASVGGAYASVVMCTVVIVLLADLFSYLVHLLQHKVKFLWEFHKVHHSAPVLHPLTSYRQHPVDTIMNTWSYTLAGGLGTGIATALFGLFPGLAKIMGITFIMFLFNLLFGNLRHSHVWLAWPPSLGWIFGSPANHQIHHSSEERHLDKNFGGVFAIWDWMFGTLYLPREREVFRMGLADGTGTEYSSILRLYGLPFVKIFRNTASRLRRGRALG
jgi:sterol desaturase/sphingolipid hydroxylase (fatty acid hydroxylase superfamily)